MRRTAVVLLSLVVLVVTGIWAVSEWRLRRRHDVAPAPFVARTAPDDLVEGRRLAILVGCLEGCHGHAGEGGIEDAPGIFRATAPTLSAVLPHYDDPALVRLIRFGIRRDGTSAIGMPAATFYFLADADLRRIIAYLRQQPAAPPQPRVRDVRFPGRVALALGMWRTSADGVDATQPRWGELPRRTPIERGRYLASIVCSECHGLDLQGDEHMKSPALGAVVGGYRLDQFRQLLRTGVPISRRDLGIMRTVASRAFVHFRDDEVSDLYAYLRAQPSSAASAPTGRQR